MTKDQLLEIIDGVQAGEISREQVVTAVDAYSSALIAAKPLVSGRSEQLATDVECSEYPHLKCNCIDGNCTNVD